MTIVRMSKSGLLMPISVAQRGTGIQSLALDEVLSAGVTSTGAMQKIKMAANNSLLISQGASLPLRADFDPAILGCEHLIETQTLNNASIANFVTGIDSSHFIYRLKIENLLPSADSQATRIRFSSNAGSSWDTGSTDYFYWLAIAGASNLYTNGNTSFCRLDYNSVPTSDGVNYFELEFINPSNSCDGNGFTFIGRYYDQGQSRRLCVIGGGRRNATQIINGIQFSMGSGTFSAVIKLYGIRA